MVVLVRLAERPSHPAGRASDGHALSRRLSGARRVGGLALLLVWLLAPPLTAAEPEPAASSGPSRAPLLGRAVPADSVFFLHFGVRPGGVLDSRLASLGDATIRSGAAHRLVAQMLDRAIAAVGPEEPDEAAASRSRWMALLGGVDWAACIAREVVLAARIEGDRREFLILCRVDAARLGGLLGGIRGLLYAVCALSPSFELEEGRREGELVYVLKDTDRGEELCLASRLDVIAISTSPRLLRHSLQLLDGTSGDLGFESAAARAAGLGGIGMTARDLEADAFEVHWRPGPLVPELPLLSEVESIVLAGRAGETGISYSFRIAFAPSAALGAPGGASGLLRRAFLDRPDVKDWAQLVPPSARSFRVTAGWDLVSLRAVMERLAVEVGEAGVDVGPDGEEERASEPGDPGEAVPPSEDRGSGAPERAGAPADDGPRRLLDGVSRLLSGRRMVLAAGDDVAVFLEIARAEESRGTFASLLTGLEASLRAGGLEPAVEDLGGAPGELRSVLLPAASGQGRKLVFGVAANYLAIGTSAALVRSAVVPGAGPAAAGKPSQAGASQASSRLPDGTAVPPGALLAVSQGEPPVLLQVLRAGLRFRELLPGTAAGDGDSSALGAAGAILPILDGLSFLGRETSFIRRDGDCLLGTGTFTFPVGAAPQREF